MHGLDDEGGVSAPSISVVICTRNRPAALCRCIAAVCAQSSKPTEVIVVDDGELDAALVGELARQVEKKGVFWYYVKKSEPGLTRSRNLALARARGEVVQFFDDDAEAACNYLAEVRAVFAADIGGDLAVLGGRLIEPSLGGFGGRAWQLASRMAGYWSLGRRGMRRTGWPNGLLAERKVLPTLRVSGAALAVRRSAVFPPGFDASLTGYALGEDRELACRLSRTHLVGVAPRAHAVHRCDPTGRLDPAAFGQATVENYCYILSKNTPMGLGEWLAVLWCVIILAGARLAFALSGNPRHHLSELLGMVRGCIRWARLQLNRTGFCW